MVTIKRWIDDLLNIEKEYKSAHPWFNWLVFGLCVAWGTFQVWTFLFPMPAFYQRTLHMLFAYLLIFLTVPAWGRRDHRVRPAGIALAILSVVTIMYAYVGWETKAFTRGMELEATELVLGLLFMALTLEVCRRSVGWTMPLVVLLLMGYARFGSLLPSVLAHRDYGFERMVTSFYISLDGVFGFLAYVSTTFIFVFVLFGSFLRISGAGDFFTRLALSLCGNVRGGPAKIAVVASSFFGMVSGSAMANVAGTGQFTIPLMKRTGFSPVYAGAVETTASAGGQIMPPVLGGAAFIMMEILGISYTAVMKHIVIIAVLFYIAIFVMVDIEAQRQRMRLLAREELPALWDTLKEGWIFLFPPLFLMFLLTFTGFSVTLNGFYATCSIVVVSWFRRESRMGLKEILLGFQETCHTFGSIAAILAAAGLLVGLVNMTGLGLMLSGTLVSLAQGNLLLLLVLTAGTSIILGMGVPTSAAYIILAILVAPALIELGVNPVSAHLFLFYYAVMAVITPPFAPDAFVAAGISGANAMATAVQACKIGLIGMLLPFAMIYSDALIMVGPPLAILGAFAGSVVGILALGAAVAGFLFHPLRGVRRFLCLVAAIALIWPELYSTLAGVLLYLGVCGLQNRQFHRDIANKYIFRYIFRRYAFAPSAADGRGVRDLNV